MTANRLFTAGAIVATVALWSTAAYQHRQLAGLRQSAAPAPTEESTAAEPGASLAPAVPTPLTESEKVTLLRLRSELAQLKRDAQIRARTGTGAAGTPTGVRAVGTNPASGNAALPPGYRRTAEFQFRGYDTPENALESLVWAAKNQDTNALIAALPPEIVKPSRPGATPFDYTHLFQSIGRMPGLRVVSKAQIGDDQATLKLQADPRNESSADDLWFRRIDGQWRIDLMR